MNCGEPDASPGKLLRGVQPLEGRERLLREDHVEACAGGFARYGFRVQLDGVNLGKMDYIRAMPPLLDL